MARSFLPNHCSNDLYCSFNCSRSYFVVLFLLLVECTLCGVFLVTPCPSCCFPSRHHCHGLLVPCFFLIIGRWLLGWGSKRFENKTVMWECAWKLYIHPCTNNSINICYSLHKCHTRLIVSPGAYPFWEEYPDQRRYSPYLSHPQATTIHALIYHWI